MFIEKVIWVSTEWWCLHAECIAELQVNTCCIAAVIAGHTQSTYIHIRAPSRPCKFPLDLLILDPCCWDDLPLQYRHKNRICCISTITSAKTRVWFSITVTMSWLRFSLFPQLLKTNDGIIFV
jgi:hypothetical protein